jgi:AcrR family transcriptional regulator
VLARDGLGGLTSRAVTTEAGCAKGVLHRHFPDFDAFLAALVADRVDRLQLPSLQPGTATVVENVAEALVAAFDPLTLNILGLVASRDQLRRRLRDAGIGGVPILTQVAGALCSYLSAEQALRRIPPGADPAALALALVGAAHLAWAGAGPAVSAAIDMVSGVLGP